jgi:hypothetical protein
LKAPYQADDGNKAEDDGLIYVFPLTSKLFKLEVVQTRKCENAPEE